MTNKIAIIALGLLILPFAAIRVRAVDNATVDVVMSIQSVDVTGIAVYDPVSTPVATSKVIKAGGNPGRAVFSNTGNGTEDFSIRIASTSGSWTPLETSANPVPQNQYRLRAIWAAFYASTNNLATTDFDDDDILTTSNQLSTLFIFFHNGSAPFKLGTPANNGGFNVPVAGVGDNQRHLFFRFDSGAAGTTGSSTAHVNVTATATP